MELTANDLILWAPIRGARARGRRRISYIVILKSDTRVVSKWGVGNVHDGPQCLETPCQSPAKALVLVAVVVNATICNKMHNTI